MSRQTTLKTLQVFLVLGVTLVSSASAYAGDAVDTRTFKRGEISVPEDTRNFLKELSQLAKKYPKQIEGTRIFEDMCEANNQCYYVPDWTACCCPSSNSCEAWPAQ